MACLADRLFVALWLSLFALSIIYPFLKSRRRFLRLALLLLVGLVFFILGERARKMHQLVNIFYHEIKNPKVRLDGDFFISDTDLGYGLKPYASGKYEVYWEGELVREIAPVTTDKGRNTYAPEVKRQLSGLFLGCSYTFGDLLSDRETWPSLVSDSLGFDYAQNMGLPAGGLAQMLLFQEEAFSDRQFDYCFIEVASWLSERSMTRFAPVAHGLRPVPYFSNSSDKIEIAPPVFESEMWELPVNHFYETPVSLSDWVEFYFEIGFPGVYGTVSKKPLIALKELFGAVPKPSKDQREIESFAYSRLVESSLAQGAVPVLVNLGAEGYRDISRAEIKNLLGQDLWQSCIYVPADSVMKATAGDQYISLYHQAMSVDGETIYFDGHPNVRAAEEISKLVVNSLRK